MKKRKLIILIFLCWLFVLPGFCAERRDAWQKPEKVMDVIGVKKGMVIGVAGAGRGYFTFKMAARVGETGKIYANEISRNCINHIKNRCKNEKIKNVTTILGEVADPLFPKGKLDMVFMCYVFHDLDKPIEFLKNIVPALKPGATVVIFEQDPGKTGSHHFLTRPVLEKKVREAGYEVVRVETFLLKDNIYICRPLRYTGHAEKAATFEEIKNPRNIAVDDTRFYVGEDATAFIYSLKNFKLKKKFGSKGQGPQEFDTLPHIPIGIDASTDKLIISSIRKISYFTKAGEFIREVRAVNQALRLRLFKDKFLGWSQAREKGILYNTICLYDARLNKIKELYRLKDSYQGPGKGYRVLHSVFTYQAYNNKIFLPGENDAAINVLDNQLKKQFSIQLNQERMKVNREFRNRLTHYFKTSRESKHIYEPLLKPLIFPDHFPVIADFFVDSGIVYVMTWKREKGANEFFTYDTKGKFIKQMMIPIRYETDLSPYPTLVYKGKLYQLVENEKNEKWELYISQIQ